MRALLLAMVLATISQAQTPAKERARLLFKEGETAYQAGKYDEAIAKYEQAFALVPLPLLLFDLGQAYRLKGMRDKAIENYSKYLDVDPNGRGAPEARQHLGELQEQARLEAKRAEEAGLEAKRAEEARKAADSKRAEEARKAADSKRAQEAQQAEAKRADDARLAAEAQRQKDEALRLKAEAAQRKQAEDRARPVWKKPWFWATLGVAVVAVGVAAGVGAVYGSPERDPTPSFGHVPGN